MSDFKGEELEAYLAAAICGDRVGAECVLESVRPLVVRYCRARLGCKARSFALADDVAREVCMAVLTALPTYREQGQPFLAFVYGIAAHMVIAARRAGGRDNSEPVPEAPVEIGRLLQVLPEKHREILVMRVVNGLSVEETAEAVGLTPVAVRVIQHRALARLRTVMAARGSTTRKISWTEDHHRRHSPHSRGGMKLGRNSP